MSIPTDWQVAEIKAGIQEADAGKFASAEEVAAVFAKWLDSPLPGTETARPRQELPSDL